MDGETPEWLNVDLWLKTPSPSVEQIRAAVYAENPGPRELALLLTTQGQGLLEEMAVRARGLTRRHFGRVVSLYVPLYLANFCSNGCAYCGFASDRELPRRQLSADEILRELASLRAMGFEEVLLLTGERTPRAGFDFLLRAVALAAERFHRVTIEAFPMTVQEYGQLGEAGCTGVTLYQETYDRATYRRYHRWGPKRDYHNRLDAPSRALEAGLRSLGIGALLGLAEPRTEMMRLYLHARRLQKRFWQSGISLSFPRVRPQTGAFVPPFPVTERQLAQFIFALRIVLPETPLVLSTRESARFRDGTAGVGITKVSAASRTTVGGYQRQERQSGGQFDIEDERHVEDVRGSLRRMGLEPVFKNTDAVFR